jgi:hypothetical protein
MRLALMLCLLSLAVTAAAAMPADIAQVERQLAEARTSQNAGALRRLLAADYFQIGADGKTATTPSSLPASPTVTGAEAQALGDSVIVTGIEHSGEATRFVRVWHRDHSAWRLVLAHFTPIGSRSSGSRSTSPLPPTVWPKDSDAERAAILTAQRTLNETFAQRDVKTYAALTADSFVRITTDGRVIGRDDFMRDVAAAGPPRQDPNHSDFRVKLYGAFATLCYLNQAADTQRVTRVFVKQQGQWRQLLTQATVVRP